MITNKLVKLAKMLMALGQTETDKGTLIYEGELAVGVEVFVESEEGALLPAEDGEYAFEDKILVVEDGKIAEIREVQEPEPEPEPEEFSAKDRFNAVKEKFEASYQEIEQNIYAALDAAGIYGYILENGDDYAIVSVYEEDDMKEHLYRYAIEIAEDGAVTLGERAEVKVQFVPVDAQPSDEPSAELAEKDARIAELEAELDELKAKLAESDARSAEEELKMSKTNVKSNVKFNLYKK